MNLGSFLQNLQSTVGRYAKQAGKLLRPVAWPVIKALRQYGLGYKETQSILEQTGLVEPDTTFYNQTTADYQMLEHESELRALGRHEIPSGDMLVEHDFGRVENYRWMIKVVGVNRFTGAPFEQFISVYTDSLMSSQRLMNSIDFTQFEGTSGELQQVLNWEVYAIQHNPGMPYQAL